MNGIGFCSFSWHCRTAAVAQQVVPAAAGPITLEQALALARANEPSFAAAAANSRVAAIDHSIARAALLPNVNYHNQVLYTQPNGAVNGGGPVGSQAAPRFIANNAVREYASQGVITETLGTATSDRGLARCRCCFRSCGRAGDCPPRTGRYCDRPLLPGAGR